MKHISRDAAVTALAPWFQGTNETVLSTEAIFRVAGRDPEQTERNLKWLHNRLLALRRHGLVASVYTDDQPRKLRAVRLLPVGSDALAEAAARKQPNRVITLESIISDIYRFEEFNPSIRVELTICLKR